MTDIKINNEKDLLNFLKIVAQESVQKSLRESDSSVESYKKQRKKDSKYFKSLREEEVLDDKQTQQDDNKPATETQPAAEENEEMTDDVDDNITPRKIISKINNIRAGHSLKNSEVKENLLSFLERLDENEMLVLFHYLDGLAKILNQTIKGADVVDPSEDPINIAMTRGEKGAQETEATPEKAKPKQQKSSGGEDTSPPIKVNESQNKDDIRRKIRILMS